MPIFSREAGLPEPVIVDGVTHIKSDWMHSGAGTDVNVCLPQVVGFNLQHLGAFTFR